jgi:hypothetical protein
MAVFTRTINTQDSRMIQKLSTVSGQVPTVAPSDNHVDGSWDSLDVYIGELFMNSADGKMWCRTSNGIKEIFVVPSTVANGDTFYLNASGGITRLPIGTLGQVLSVSSGNVPSWVNKGDISGTFTPTVTNISPNTTTITFQNMIYSQVGNVVIFSCYFEVAFDTGESFVTFEIDLPIATTFGDSKSIIGTMTSDSANFTSGFMESDGSIAALEVEGVVSSTITYVWFTGQYIVA